MCRAATASLFGPVVFGLAVFGLFAVASVVSPRLAQAEPASPAPVAAEPSVADAEAGRPASPALGGIALLASVGWGASTADVLRLELSPYGASAGLDVGYTWPAGFRVGGYFVYSLGRSVSQLYDPLIGRPYDLTADTSSLNAGLSIGYDVPLYAFILRYSLGAGVTSMSWDFGSTPPDIAEYSDNPSVGVHLAPAATLLWQHGVFEAGVGFRYLVQAKGGIPNGFLGELLVGVRL